MWKNSSIPFAVVVSILCLVYTGLLVQGIFINSPVFDETTHIASGYSYWRTADFRMNREHPPFVKLLSAIPLLFLEPGVDLESKSWQEGDQWGFARDFLFHWNRPDTIVPLARMGNILMALLLFLLLLRFSMEFHGRGGALLSLTLLTFSPSILAHSTVVTTDLPCALLYFASSCLLYRFLVRPSIPSALLLGLSSGLAAGSKFSSLIIFPVILTLTGIRILHLALKGPSREGGTPGRYVTLTLLSIALSILAISALYGTPFDLSGYYEGIRNIGYNHPQNYPFFLLGRYSEEGFPFYFLLTFLMKTPMPVLAILLMALLLPLFRIRSSLSLHNFSLIIPPILYYGVMEMNAPDIGHRYILPVYPFLFLAAGGLGGIFEGLWRRRRRLLSLLLPLLLLLDAFSTLIASPDFIPYFNGLFRGCVTGSAIRCLDDSNIDWGESFLILKGEMEGRGLLKGSIRGTLYGTAEVDYYIPGFEEMQESEFFHPLPSIYIVSAHRRSRMEGWAGTTPARPIPFTKRVEPLFVAGSSVYVYDLREGL